MNSSGVSHDHMDTRSSTLVSWVSLIEVAVSTASWSSSFSGMYGIGSFTRPLPRSHYRDLSPSRTALLILRFLRALPTGVPTKRGLWKLLGGTLLKQWDGLLWSLLRCKNALPFLWIADEWLSCTQKIISPCCEKSVSCNGVVQVVVGIAAERGKVLCHYGYQLIVTYAIFGSSDNK